MTTKGLFVFRRDLRIQDNTALHHACHECDTVVCLFILTPTQIKNNPYFSYNAFCFMLESLIELKKSIPIIIEYGEPSTVIHDIIKKHKITDIYLNKDYTPYAIERDLKITELIEKVNKKLHSAVLNTKTSDLIPDKTSDLIPDKTSSSVIQLHLHNDIALNEPASIKPYKVFTPYYNVAKKTKVSNTPLSINVDKILDTKHKSVNLVALLSKYNKHTAPERQRGGRSNVIPLIKKLKTLTKYSTTRDDLTTETSRLSPYIKFGVIGIREVYRLSPSKSFTKELFWRDFYMQISYYFPNVLIDKEKLPALNSSSKPATYDISKNFKSTKVKWFGNSKLYNAWCTGTTGIPVVDAAMRQLLQTGYMHNRCRMIVASVLTKLFHIDWRYGEQFFAVHLTDYDPCSNNGGWQWASGTGADAQPYFRIFNPYAQAEKHDPTCNYIKKWCPDLAKLTPKEIFALRSDLFDYDKERVIGISLFSNKK